MEDINLALLIMPYCIVHAYHLRRLSVLADSMAKLGLAGGILTQAACASTAVYTLFLLQSLYHEVKRKQVSKSAIFMHPPETLIGLKACFEAVFMGHYQASSWLMGK